MANIFIPRPHSGYLNAYHGLMIFLILLFAFLATALTWTAVKAETQNCDSNLWETAIYNVRPDYYAKKCGCPNNLDFRFKCNSQYIPIL
jgi:hypothetical protein